MIEWCSYTSIKNYFCVNCIQEIEEISPVQIIFFIIASSFENVDDTFLIFLWGNNTLM